MARPLGNAHFDLVNDTEEDQSTPVYEPQFHCGSCDEDVPVSHEMDHINGRCIVGYL